MRRMNFSLVEINMAKSFIILRPNGIVNHVFGFDQYFCQMVERILIFCPIKVMGTALFMKCAAT